TASDNYSPTVPTRSYTSLTADGPQYLANRVALVAADLDLHHGACAAFEVQRRQLLELPDLKDLFDGTNRPAGPKDLLHHVHQLRPPVGAHHHVDAGDGGDLVGRVLYVAPHRDHHGPGIDRKSTRLNS